MAEGKKFGTFGGVFTPSILTILGAIMYLRFGQVVGNAGLVWMIVIVVVAHVISVSTGLSISSIATDKKVGAGGVYYVLSRSLGLPIGGALGMTLFVATGLSISLYMVAFAENVNEFIGYGYEMTAGGGKIASENLINTYRVTGSIALLVLTIIAFISTTIAIKTQYFILLAIAISLGAIFMGDGANITPVDLDMDTYIRPSFGVLFALFFPAVTGFTAGVAMSGDLKDPKKAIPVGTMGAILVGLIVYLVLGFFIHYSIDERVLVTNNNALVEWATIAMFVYIGVWGATLSSALGGILGGPRILQAMSVDKLTPKIFAKGVGSSNEPRNALILTVLIAEAGILIGDLNVIAEVVSMFYLAAYGFINLSFFLESWASSDFKPTFKVNKLIGLIGFMATIIVMSQINLGAMVAAFIIIGGVYFYLSRKQIALGTGDIWQSVWSTIVKKGLKRMESGSDHKRNWKPNTLLFSTDSNHRSKMIEFSKAVSGHGGIITNFDLHENEDAKVLFPKSKEIVEDEELEKHGIFGRRLEVQNVFKGIESIACTFGFSGIEPNTVLMNWPGQTKDPKWFTAMTEKLIELDYNVLYLDYDERWGFRKKSKIDLWWRGVGNNAELMLSLAKFITSSPDWSQANIRILLANESNVDFKVVENRIRTIVEQFRVKAEIKVVNNELDKKPLYDLMKMHSSEADLVFVGIPDINEDGRDEFVSTTNNLVSVIGTTLLVKASSQFDETDLKLETVALHLKPRVVEQTEVIALDPIDDKNLYVALYDLDTRLDEITTKLIQDGIQPVENYHHAIFSKVISKMDLYLLRIGESDSRQLIQESLHAVLADIRAEYEDAIENRLPLVYESLDESITAYFSNKESLITYLVKKIHMDSMINEKGEVIQKKRSIRYRESIQQMWFSKGLKGDFSCLLEFGYNNLILLHQSKNILHDVIWDLLESIDRKGIDGSVIESSKLQLNSSLHQIDDEALNLASNLYRKLRNNERSSFNSLAKTFLSKRYSQILQKEYPPLSSRNFKVIRKGTNNFPAYWYRNLILFTYHLDADIYLIDYTAQVKGLINEISNYTRENYLNKIDENVLSISNQLEVLKKQIESNNEKEVLGTAIRISEELYFNSESVISKLLGAVQELNKGIPEEVELMTAKSINGIGKAQGEEIETENIALKDITEYLTRTHFVDPLHERIQEFYEQLKRLTGLLIHTTVLVQKGIDSYSTTNKIAPLKEILDQSKSEIKAVKDDFISAQEGFEAEMYDRQQLLRKELDINQIIEQAESLRQYVKQQKRRNVILDKFQEVNKKATKKVGNLFDYLAQKKQDLTAIEYKAKYEGVASEQGLIANFISDIGPQTELPFYYQQLFTGTHYSDSKTIDNRKSEIEAIKTTIKQIDNGTIGAIAILGSAGSGKTYLATHVSSHELEGSLYKILPPLNRTWTKDDLTWAIQRATGINEPFARIFNKIPAKTTFIFENIEQWWLKAPQGDRIITGLVRLINKYGGKHYFILTANINAYNLMRQHTIIQNAVIQTIILAPLNANQIKDAIWSRHQTGGLRIKLNTEHEQHISVNKLNKYLTKFHTLSKGNIGLALHLWINSIKLKDENLIVMKPPFMHELDNIESQYWKNIIFQLFIHYNLSREELYRIYGDENKNWISRVLIGLKNARLLQQNERGEFYLNKSAKPYIEKWLNEYGFIK